MEITHIRDDIRTYTVIEPFGKVMDWVALCGADKPGSSVSARHMRQVMAGEILPFAPAVVICSGCLFKLQNARLPGIK